MDGVQDEPSDTAAEVSEFEAMGDYACAAQLATHVALRWAASSAAAGRIPIAAAVVEKDGASLKVVAEGCNGRIPADDGHGYPTDHGETGALRSMEFAGVDWARCAFATSLSPCIMCTRTLMHLHGLGLRRIVIAESTSFGGKAAMLRELDGMIVVELTNRTAIKNMATFARTYPWDWAADIGEVPPAAARLQPAEPADVWRQLRERGEHAAVVDSDGAIIASAADERRASGGNPVRSASMIAMGRAGSAINLREHTLVVCTDFPSANIAAFGNSSLGACELFRPCAVCFDVPVEAGLEAALRAAGVAVRCAPEQRAASKRARED
jgi:tRNA(Arg) A34 adenosine deaminase TadA